jgi:hypothetical protein
MMPRVVAIGDCTLGLTLQLTPKVQRPICLFETHGEEQGIRLSRLSEKLISKAQSHETTRFPVVFALGCDS